MHFSWIFLCGAAGILACGIAFFLTPTVRRLSVRIGAQDFPIGHHIHKIPTPTLGGVAIAAGVLTGWGLLYALCAPPWMGRLVVGAFLFLLWGAFDDVHPLCPLTKLAGQSVIAALAVLLGTRFPGVRFHSFSVCFGRWEGVAAFLWILLLCNAINIIDGLDGLFCGVGAIAAATLCVLSFSAGHREVAAACGCLFGGCVGFFCYNHHPAVVFAGDTGTMFVGYALAILSMEGIRTQFLIEGWTLFLLFAFPLCDFVFAVVRRLAKGKNPFCADQGHLHHRLLHAGLSQRQAVRRLLWLCGVGSVTAILFFK